MLEIFWLLRKPCKNEKHGVFTSFPAISSLKFLFANFLFAEVPQQLIFAEKVTDTFWILLILSKSSNLWEFINFFLIRVFPFIHEFMLNLGWAIITWLNDERSLLNTFLTATTVSCFSILPTLNHVEWKWLLALIPSCHTLNNRRKWESRQGYWKNPESIALNTVS